MDTRRHRIGLGRAMATASMLMCVAIGFPSSRAALASGGLDPTFGTGGLVVSALSPASDVAHAVAIQPDGRIVVAEADSAAS